MKSCSRLAFLLLPASLAFGPACSCAGDSADGSGAGSTQSGPSSSGTGGSTSTGFVDGDFVSIEIEPASAQIVVVNGAVPAATSFTAFGVRADGTRTNISPQWSYTRPDVAQTSNAGAVSATGLLGGSGTLRATLDALQGQAEVSVKLVYDSNPSNVPQDVQDLFDNASVADPSMALLYPYDQTVFPRGLMGPVVQWNGGGASDVYRVHVESPYFELEAWGAVPPPSRFAFPTLPDDLWRKLTDSTVGDLAVRVQRYDGATAYQPVAQTWKIAPGNLAGTIYYWEVNQGNVVRLRPGAPGPEQFLQKPAGVTCVACHSVSADGSTIVASFQGGYSPWGTFDAETGSSIYATDISSGFQAISPSGSHVLWGHWNSGSFGGDGLLKLSTRDDSTVLAQLASPGAQPSHPAWSKDGNKIAFAGRTDGNGLDFTQSTLWIADVSTNPPSFSNSMQIVANDAARPTVTFPTFSPDSKWVAFMRSTQARTRGAAAEIWLTDPTGATQIRLDRANGQGVLSGGQESITYEPTFNPVAAGGYFWLVVVSERQYGNTLTDTNPDTRRKQLWVTAIDQNPQPGVDPSHPAFWLPGQELDNQNMRGEWALSPCKALGSDCSAGYECCDGYCVQDAQSGSFVCAETPGGCSNIGDLCETADDCCDPGAECINNVCALDVPQ